MVGCAFDPKPCMRSFPGGPKYQLLLSIGSFSFSDSSSGIGITAPVLGALAGQYFVPFSLADVSCTGFFCPCPPPKSIDVSQSLTLARLLVLRG